MESDPKIKEAFSKVKEDILSLKTTLQELKEGILAKETETKSLKEEIKALKDHLGEKSPESNPIFLPSNRNKGVFRQTDNRQTTDTRQIIDSEANIESIFISLTEKEFVVFLSLYQLEEEFTTPISYTQLANKLSLSQSSIRDHVAELIRKQAPILKIKPNNKKVLLSVDKTFKALNLMSRILDIRHYQDTQTPLTF